MSKFSKVKIQGAEFLQDPCGAYVLHVSNPHALSQAVGYLKFTADKHERIFLRGQSKIYETLQPSLYRDISSTTGQSRRHAKLNNAIDIFRNNCSIFEKFPKYSHEPLLQHYGIKTTWIDIVDNLWIALWFSVFESYSVGRNSEYLHFDLRPQEKDNNFGYILLISATEDGIRTKKGILQGKNTEVIDLRIAAPSVFLRPHAQHGLLFRVRGKEDGRIRDYSKAISGILRYNLSDAINWLGSGCTKTVFT